MPLTTLLMSLLMSLRVTFLAGLVALLPITLHAQSKLSTADSAAVRQVDDYLNGINTLRARFVQLGPTGELSRGALYIRRPGRLRFEYDPPTPIMVMSDGLWLILVDKELAQADRWPIYDTPLGVLVKEDVQIEKELLVDHVIREAGQMRISLRDPKRPDEGRIEMTFATPALELRNWTVTDSQGGKTNVSLSNIETGVKLDPKLFFFEEKQPSDERE
jgi:outer membrane lipoprotein-sorting protein